MRAGRSAPGSSPRLVEHGHDVIASSRTAGKANRLASLGARPVTLDLLDPAAVREAVAAAAPEAIVHEATALAGTIDFKPSTRASRRRTGSGPRGTDALLSAAWNLGVTRFVAQSFAGWPYARVGGPVKTEEAPLDSEPIAEMAETLATIRHVEQAAVERGGIALRYGGFYGDPGRRPGRARAQAALPARRRRRRHLLVRPPGRRGRRHRPRGRARRARRLQRRRRRPRPRPRVAARLPRRSGRSRRGASPGGWHAWPPARPASSS